MKTKHLTLLLAAMLVMALGNTAQATILTLSNTSIPAQYTTWADAYAAAQPGDTIQIMPSPTSYGNMLISKPVTLIGTGHRSINEQGGNERVIVGKIDIESGGSGSNFIGLDVTSTFYPVQYHDVSNIVARKCIFRTYTLFGYNSTGTNWWYDGNVFAHTSHFLHNSGSNARALNCKVTNNIFTDGYYIHNLYNSTVEISNNVFLDSWGGSEASAINGASFLVVRDNIFIGRSFPSVSNSTFRNNIIYAEGVTAVGGTNTDVDNIYANPQFVNYDAATHEGGFTVPEFYNFDFTLDAASSPVSPGLGAASDGGNIGVKPSFSLFGTPAAPQITFFQILTPTVPSQGAVQVQIKAESGSN